MSLSHFATILKLLRKEGKMSQAVLAEKLSVSVRQVQLLEAAKAEPSYNFLLQVSEVFNVAPSSFFTDYSADDNEEVDFIYDTIHIISRTGTFVRANLAQGRMLQTPRSQLIGMSIFDFMPEEAEIDSLKKYLAFLCETKPYPTPYVSQYRCAKGREFAVEVDWRYLLSREGEVQGFLSIVRERQ